MSCFHFTLLVSLQAEDREEAVNNTLHWQGRVRSSDGGRRRLRLWAVVISREESSTHGMEVAKLGMSGKVKLLLRLSLGEAQRSGKGPRSGKKGPENSRWKMDTGGCKVLTQEGEKSGEGAALESSVGRGGQKGEVGPKGDSVG